MIGVGNRSRLEFPTGERVLAAAENLFGERGYHGTHLRELAAVVGIQKASLFYHFSSKEELYRSVLRRSATEIGAQLQRTLTADASFRERLHFLIAAYVGLATERPARTRMLLRELIEGLPLAGKAVLHEFEPVFSMVVDFVREGQRAQAFRPVDPAPLILSIMGMAAFFVAVAPAIAPKWVAEIRSRGEMAKAVTDFLVEIVEPMLLARPELALSPET